jgi:hypothetical protein
MDQRGSINAMQVPHGSHILFLAKSEGKEEEKSL